MKKFLLFLDVRELGLDEATNDLVQDSASRLISKAGDRVSERELDRVRADLGRLQRVVHEALERNGAGGAATKDHSDG